MGGNDNKEQNLLLDAIIKGIEDKKGYDIAKIYLGDLENAIADYFIICHGTSKVQVDAIADSVLDVVNKQTKNKPWHKEGFENAEWILIDYVDVVVHVFIEEIRRFFNLEDLWADADINYISTDY